MSFGRKFVTLDTIACVRRELFVVLEIDTWRRAYPFSSAVKVSAYITNSVLYSELEASYVMRYEGELESQVRAKHFVVS